MSPLTDRQRQVLAFIASYQGVCGYPPTTREIADRFDFVQNAAMNHLRALKEKGRIDWRPNRARTIRIL